MIRVAAGYWHTIERHCIDAAPDEAVGYLAAVRGAEEQITDVVPVMNVADDAHARYEVDEREQLEVWQLLEERHKRPVVTYHSHVNAAARMSPMDIEMARDSRMLHLIVSVAPGHGVVDVTMWRVGYAAGVPLVEPVPFMVERVDGWHEYTAFPQV